MKVPNQFSFLQKREQDLSCQLHEALVQRPAPLPMAGLVWRFGGRRKGNSCTMQQPLPVLAGCASVCWLRNQCLQQARSSCCLGFGSVPQAGWARCLAERCCSRTEVPCWLSADCRQAPRLPRCPGKTAGFGLAPPAYLPDAFMGAQAE